MEKKLQVVERSQEEVNIEVDEKKQPVILLLRNLANGDRFFLCEDGTPDFLVSYTVMHQKGNYTFVEGSYGRASSTYFKSFSNVVKIIEE